MKPPDKTAERHAPRLSSDPFSDIFRVVVEARAPFINAQAARERLAR